MSGSSADVYGDLPLSGVRVLAVEQFLAGPYGTLILANAGAEVIKVEPPGQGEPGRTAGGASAEDAEGRRITYTLLRTSCNKGSLSLDLRSDEGRAVFYRLVEKADIVWENSRPGVMERRGLGYERLSEINPRLIYVSVSGFGQSGPYRDWAAFDIISQSMGGLMYRAGKEGDPPRYNGIPIGDSYAGVMAAMGATQALYRRDRTGKGCRVDVAMYDSMVMLCEMPVGFYAVTGQLPPRGRNPGGGPFEAFKTADGYVAIAVVGDEMWERFCGLIGRPDLTEHPQLQSAADRARYTDNLIRPAVEAWSGLRTRHEVWEILHAERVPVAPVQDVEDMLACPHLKARNMLPEVEIPARGRVQIVGNPIKMTGVADPEPTPPPQVGDQTRDVLRTWLDLNDGEIEGLRERGTI